MCNALDMVETEKEIEMNARTITEMIKTAARTGGTAVNNEHVVIGIVPPRSNRHARCASIMSAAPPAASYLAVHECYSMAGYEDDPLSMRRGLYLPRDPDHVIKTTVVPVAADATTWPPAIVAAARRSNCSSWIK